jgi:hypothetical protein
MPLASIPGPDRWHRGSLGGAPSLSRSREYSGPRTGRTKPSPAPDARARDVGVGETASVAPGNASARRGRSAAVPPGPTVAAPGRAKPTAGALTSGAPALPEHSGSATRPQATRGTARSASAALPAHGMRTAWPPVDRGRPASAVRPCVRTLARPAPARSEGRLTAMGPVGTPALPIAANWRAGEGRSGPASIASGPSRSASSSCPRSRCAGKQRGQGGGKTRCRTK